MNDLMGGRRAGLAQALMNRRMGGRGGAYPHGMPGNNMPPSYYRRQPGNQTGGVMPPAQNSTIQQMGQHLQQTIDQRPPGFAFSPPNEMQNEVNPMTGSVRAQQMFPNGVGLQKPNDVAMTPGINPMAKPLMSNAMKRPPAYTQPGIPVMPANDLA